MKTEMSDPDRQNNRETAKALIVPQGTAVKAAVEDFLRERGIELVYEDPDQSPPKTVTKEAPNPKILFYGPDGGGFHHKPESLTHLKGHQLVHKDHPVIVLRGKLDSLASAVLEAQLLGHKKDAREFVNDLEEVLSFVRRLLSDEFRGRQVGEFNLLNLDAAALRERSHDPKKFYGHNHMLTSYKMGPLCIALNSLRTLTRETELAAAAALKENGREDIVQALNRLSSLFYIMMFKYLPDGFEPESSGI